MCMCACSVRVCVHVDIRDGLKILGEQAGQVRQTCVSWLTVQIFTFVQILIKAVIILYRSDKNGFV